MPFSARGGLFAPTLTPAATPWTPAQITTTAWLKGDADQVTLSGTNVTSWNNKGNGSVDFSQSTSSKQPTYDSTNKFVLFDGSDDVLQADSLLGVGTPDPILTCVAITNIEDYDGQFGGVAGKFFQIGGNPSGGSNGVWSIATGSGSVGYNYRFNNGFQSFNNSTLDVDALTSWQSDATAQYQNMKFFLNGTEKSGTGGSSNTISLSTGTAFTYLGGGPGGNSNQFMFANIKIYELVCFASGSTSDRQKAEGYLAWEYDLEGSLPADHPYKSAAPTI